MFVLTEFHSIMNGQSYTNRLPVYFSLWSVSHKLKWKVLDSLDKIWLKFPKIQLPTEPRSNNFVSIKINQKKFRGKSFEIRNRKINLGNVDVVSRYVSFLVRWHFLQWQHKNLREGNFTRIWRHTQISLMLSVFAVEIKFVNKLRNKSFFLSFAEIFQTGFEVITAGSMETQRIRMMSDPTPTWATSNFDEDRGCRRPRRFPFRTLWHLRWIWQHPRWQSVVWRGTRPPAWDSPTTRRNCKNLGCWEVIPASAEAVLSVNTSNNNNKIRSRPLSTFTRLAHGGRTASLHLAVLANRTGSLRTLPSLPRVVHTPSRLIIIKCSAWEATALTFPTTTAALRTRRSMRS